MTPYAWFRLAKPLPSWDYRAFATEALMTIPLTERYAPKIRGVLSCFDRILLTGTLPDICHPDAITLYLKSKGIKIFDYQKEWAKPRAEEIRSHAERVAKENSLPIEYVSKRNFRKEDRVKQILESRGFAPGLVHIFSAIETCTEFRPWHDKPSGKTFLRRKDSKCLHYYFYFIDPDLGLCHLRIPTWAPFRLQFYCNGHEILANQLRQKGVAFDARDNALIQIDDWKAAQELADTIDVEALHQRLDDLVRRFCLPIVERFPSGYHWSFMQVEYSTDVVFDRQAELAPIYDKLIRTAVHAVKAEDVATFLGRKLTDRTSDEVGNRFETRIEGTRIRHHMGWAAIKMYDKHGLILRIETVCNDVSFFRHYRQVEHLDGSRTRKLAAMKKSIYSMHALREVMAGANHRYLEFLSTLDDPTSGISNLDRISQPTHKGDRSHRGFNLFTTVDQRVFEVLLKGQFNINGFRNRDLRAGLGNKPTQAARILARLRLHGLIEKIARQSRYYLTPLGRAVAVAALGLRTFFLIPQLASPLAWRC